MQVSLKSDRNNLHDDQYTLLIICHSLLLTMRRVLDKCYRKSKNTLCSVAFSRKRFCLWDNVEKPFRAGQATDDNMELVHFTVGT